MNSLRMITVINGPNLSQLGKREPAHYGNTTQSELIDKIEQKASAKGVSIEFFQSDIEGELVQAISRASGNAIGIVINPAAYSHYSIAILDALSAFDGPVVEVHISQVLSRESFRSDLITARAADAFIAGAGITGYLDAIDIVCDMADENVS